MKNSALWHKNYLLTTLFFTVMRIRNLTLLGIIRFTISVFVSCDPWAGYGQFWLLYVKGNDTLSVEYPLHIYSKKHAFYKNTYQTIEVSKDTLFVGDSRLHNGLNIDNLELQVTRVTKHEDVKILFLIDELWPYHMFDSEDLLYRHALDSMMDIYGVTMPVNKDLMTVPATVNPK